MLILIFGAVLHPPMQIAIIWVRPSLHAELAVVRNAWTYCSATFLQPELFAYGGLAFCFPLQRLSLTREAGALIAILFACIYLQYLGLFNGHRPPC